MYLHSIYLGYVFYWIPGDNDQLTPVHYGPSFKYIEERTFYDEQAQEQVVGGFYLKYKTLKEPKFAEKVSIFDLIPKTIDAWEHPKNKKLNVPERKILKLNKPKWWEKDEEEQWLKENNSIQYFREHFTDKYNPEDDHDFYEIEQD